MDEQQKRDALTSAAAALGNLSPATREVLGDLWNVAFEQGRLAALDELQDRFCVCMK